MPDGPVWELPFQVLRTPRSEDLIDRYTISSVPSLSVLHESMSRRARRRASIPSVPTSFGLSNPALGGDPIGRVEALIDERLEPLPEAERRAGAAVWIDAQQRLRADRRERGALLQAESMKQLTAPTLSATA